MHPRHSTRKTCKIYKLSLIFVRASVVLDAPSIGHIITTKAPPSVHIHRYTGELGSNEAPTQLRYLCVRK
jgi:hypothetical protein